MLLHVSAVALGRDAFARSRLAGLRPMGNEDSLLPQALPMEFCPPLGVDFGVRRGHCCHAEIEVDVPAVLAHPVEFVRSVSYPHHAFRSNWLWRPYWIAGKLVHFDWQHPGPDYRDATPVEVLCAMAQYPELGSVSCPASADIREPVEACFWPGMHGVQWHLSPPHGDYHHRLFVRRKDAPSPPSGLERCSSV